MSDPALSELDDLELPSPVVQDDDVGIVDPSDEIDWTPPGANDDSDAEDLPIGEIDVEDDEERDSSLEGLDAEFGEADGLIAEEASFALADDSPIALDEADGIDDDEAHEMDDGGVEGTSEDIGEGIDEAALPEVDADEDGAFDLGDLMRELAQGGFGRESDGPPWIARDEWTTADPFEDVVASAGRVVAVGSELVVLEPSARAVRRSRLPAHASRVAMSGPTVVVGAGETVTLIGPSALSGKPPLILFEGPKPVRALGLAAGRVWVVAGDELWVIASPPSTPKRVRRSGALDVAVAGTQLFLLSHDAGSFMLERFRGDDGDWHKLALADLRGAARSLAVSSSGEALAVLATDSFAVSWDAGARFEAIPLSSVVGACFGGAEGKTLYVLSAPDGEVSLRAVTATGVEEIAVLDERMDRMVRDVRLAWCEAREALIMVSADGSLAIGPRRTH